MFFFVARFPRLPLNGLVECPYCHNVWTIPKKETSPAALSFLRMGEHELDTGKFDDAFTAYKKAAELDSKEPEAYFGMALATFKVQYLKVEPTKEGEKLRMQPICHGISDRSFSEDKNYLRALELSNDEKKAVYRKRAEEIDDIRNQFQSLRQKGLHYDCFISVKIHNEKGEYTQDSHDASNLYQHLQKKGYHPFYSEVETNGMEGAEYEAHILYALYTAECMLLICFDEDYLQTPWVKNEYTRFSAMMYDTNKEQDAITFVFKGNPVERLPGRNGKLQGIDLAKPDAYSRIENYVERHTPQAKARREEEARKQAEQENNLLEELRLSREARERAEKREEELKRQAELDARRRQAEEERRKNEEELKRRAEEEERRKRDLEREKETENLRRMVRQASQGTRATVGSKLTRAWQEMDARDFNAAQKYFLTVVEEQPENAEAWRGLFLAELRVTSEQVLAANITEQQACQIMESQNLKNYLRYKSSNEFDRQYNQLAKSVKQALSDEEQRSKDELLAEIEQLNADKRKIKRIHFLRRFLPFACFFVIMGIAAVLPFMIGLGSDFRDFLGFIPGTLPFAVIVTIVLTVKCFRRLKKDDEEFLSGTMSDRQNLISTRKAMVNEYSKKVKEVDILFRGVK